MPISEITGGKSTSESHKTFKFENEGHTLGNALKTIISRLPDVLFCSYHVPHPTEAEMQLRIQMRQGRAVDALRRGLEELAAVCDHISEEFQTEVEQFKDSKINAST